MHAPTLRLLTTSAGLLALLLFAPGGFASGLYALRDRVWRAVPPPEPAPAGAAGAVAAP